ncbi:hypothetical protein V6Z11_D01G178700 [Gossypium hirsutum]
MLWVQPLSHRTLLPFFSLGLSIVPEEKRTYTIRR